MKALFKSLSVTLHWLCRGATCSVIGFGESIANASFVIVIPHFRAIKNPCKNLTQQDEKHCDDTLNALCLHGNKTNNNTEITKRGIIQIVLNIANNDKIVK
ncbi:hypothetical protein HMPREF6745_1129 [Prevotella sp. oral taxon 472 str. F0295]|nr:hypothetical protein HMPREF6745_1129 [Prevotella sp. oral taxon 472 str. F0295]